MYNQLMRKRMSVTILSLALTLVGALGSIPASQVAASPAATANTNASPTPLALSNVIRRLCQR